MYKELATIKDGSKVTGFVAHDGEMVHVLDMDQAAWLAMMGEMDTFYYKDGQFIPFINQNIYDKGKDGGRRRTLEYVLKHNVKMTFDEYVDNDCNFRKQDVDLMFRNENVVLANVCLAQEFKIGNSSFWLLTMAFWCPDRQSADKLRTALDLYKDMIPTIRRMKDYDGFIMLNLPLADGRYDYDLFTLQKRSGLDFIYNINMLSNMKERVKNVRSQAPFFVRQIMKFIDPTERGLAGLSGVLREANRISAVHLSVQDDSLLKEMKEIYADQSI